MAKITSLMYLQYKKAVEKDESQWGLVATEVTSYKDARLSRLTSLRSRSAVKNENILKCSIHPKQYGGTQKIFTCHPRGEKPLKALEHHVR